MVGVFREVRRVLRDDGTCWVNMGDGYAGSGKGAWSDESRDDNAHRVKESYVPSRSESPLSGHVPASLKPKDLIGQPWLLAKALQAPYYTGTIRHECDRVWLAAMIDAEGCIFIHKRKVGQSNGQGYTRKADTYGSGLEVSNTSRAIVDRVARITGRGSICHQDGHGRKQRLYRWNLRSNECREVLREVYPHLVAKQHEARLAIGCPSSGSKATSAHESLKALHNGGEASIDFAAPESMFEPGWYLRSDVVWKKKNPMPESVTDRPTKAHEYVFLFTKSARYFYDAEAVRERASYGVDVDPTKFNGVGSSDRQPSARESAAHSNEPSAGRNLRDVWTIATQPYAEAHFATYPEALVRPCVKAGTSERGCCPACGAGWVRVMEADLSNVPTRIEQRRAPVDVDAVAAYLLERREARGLTRRDVDEHLGTKGMCSWYEGRPAGTEPPTASKWVELKALLRLDDRFDAQIFGMVDVEVTDHSPPKAFGVRTYQKAWNGSRVDRGFRPSCECGADAIPCTVLDPFSGSGTTGVVACGLGRDYIGIELNPEYAAMSERRIGRALKPNTYADQSDDGADAPLFNGETTWAN